MHHRSLSMTSMNPHLLRCQRTFLSSTTAIDNCDLEIPTAGIKNQQHNIFEILNFLCSVRWLWEVNDSRHRISVENGEMDFPIFLISLSILLSSKRSFALLLLATLNQNFESFNVVYSDSNELRCAGIEVWKNVKSKFASFHNFNLLLLGSLAHSFHFQRWYHHRWHFESTRNWKESFRCCWNPTHRLYVPLEDFGITRI